MNSSDFVTQLLEENTEILKRLEPRETLEADVGKSINMIALLKAALRNEMEAIEIAALWIPDTSEPDIKLALARQTGDEAKHYQLIKERLTALGENPSVPPSEAPPKTKLFGYLSSLTSSIERAAAGQFTREHIAMVKNNQFVHYCKEVNDTETLAMYQNVICPDEEYHHLLGKTILEKYATSDELQEQARAASLQTLHLAEEMQRVASEALGTGRGPGC
jgi:bacterioferritin (cytochrome b1)